jgi:hypothetical protein
MTLEPSLGALVLLTSLSRRVYRRAIEDGMRLKHASARCRARGRLSVDAPAHEVQ